MRRTNQLRLKSFGIPMAEEVTGYVYWIQMDRIGPIKIGFTKNIEKRLISLQTGSPYPLNLLCVMPANEGLEKNIHSCYGEIRLQGEWFLPHPNVFQGIEQVKQFNIVNEFRGINPRVDFHPPLLSDEYDEWYRNLTACKKGRDAACKSILIDSINNVSKEYAWKMLEEAGLKRNSQKWKDYSDAKRIIVRGKMINEQKYRQIIDWIGEYLGID